MVSTMVASVAGLLLGPAGTGALPPANPPEKLPAGTLVHWPVKHQVTVIEPGAKLTISVRSSRRPVTVSLNRAGISGRVFQSVAKRTLRRGTYTIKAREKGIFALRLTVAGKRYWSWVVVGKDICYQFGDTAQLRLPTPTVATGGTLAYEIVNTSAGCLVVGHVYGIEQLRPDGTWTTAVPLQGTLAGFWLGGGQTFARTAQIPATLAVGAYRLTTYALGDGTSPEATIPLSAAFQVVQE
jgi:hypothetical protein